MDAFKIEDISPETLDTRVSYKKDEEPIETIKQENIVLPSYDYGRSQEQLDYETQIRNKPTSSAMYNACLLQSGGQASSSGVETLIGNLTIVSGDAAMTATANRITITVAGTYLISASMFDSTGSGVGYRGTIIRKNGANVFVGRTIASATSALDTPAQYPLALVAGDYIELATFQNSGSNMTVTTAYLAAIKIA